MSKILKYFGPAQVIFALMIGIVLTIFISKAVYIFTVWQPEYEAWVAACEDRGGRVSTERDEGQFPTSAPANESGIVLIFLEGEDYWCLDENNVILDHYN